MRKIVSARKAPLWIGFVAVFCMGIKCGKDGSEGGGGGGPTVAGWFWRRPAPQGNTLNDVAFVNIFVGWAVGENGTTRWIVVACCSERPLSPR